MSRPKASEVVEIDQKFIDQVVKKLYASKPQQDTNTILTTKEVAGLIHVGRHTVVRYIESYNQPDKYPNTPKLKAVKSGRSWLIEKKDFETFLQNPKNPDYE